MDSAKAAGAEDSATAIAARVHWQADQIDGWEHHRFEDRGPACTALIFLDDATSRLMQILFNGTELTFGYFAATRRVIDQHGQSLAFYSDMASMFCINMASAESGQLV